ncbi:MAG: hypothetical protein IJR46_01105 [Neisseriaceae bacterium]|nr:hypothetical protein [Neisseriaceae bacterium]
MSEQNSFSDTIDTLSKHVADKAKNTQPDWLRDLQNIRQHREQNTSELQEVAQETQVQNTVHTSVASAIDSTYREQTNSYLHQPISRTKTFTQTQEASETHETQHTLPEKDFGDEELNVAYRQFLQQRVAEHNENISEQNIDDTALLVMEDWILAQSSLESRRKSWNMKTKENFVVNEPEPSDAQTTEEQETQPPLPTYAVHVYDLPELPASQSVDVISEQELLNLLREHLITHLNEALSGMVRRIIQKEMAVLSYELHAQLNQETPKLVEDVLNYQLETALKSVKHKLRQQ